MNKPNQLIQQIRNQSKMNEIKLTSVWIHEFVELNCWIKFECWICCSLFIHFGFQEYYNSITRQSGIVHKDKAMRQLDLFLLQWLVAGSEGSNKQFSKINFICWIDFNQFPFWREKLNWINLQQQNELIWLAELACFTETGQSNKLANQSINAISFQSNFNSIDFR